jgi:F0F1-type ATP synthase assembly protein I
MGSGKYQNIGRAAAFSYVGIQLLVVALLGFFGGSWIDEQLGTPWIFTLLLIMVGMAACVIQLVRTVQRFEKEDSEEDEYSS